MTYNLGPELSRPGWKIKLEVHNENKIVPGHNVMGYIYGSEEPDRYARIWLHNVYVRSYIMTIKMSINRFFCLKDTLYWETIEMLGHMVQSIPTQLLLV